ncbi:hypothetical protein FNV43_RR18453 [Rhamnella rubrinervis]|uniref:CID domain-containing protein n=1 Tax=Rhamnella rubrinervis TaxID=2594499 RepID=A0A8K0E5W2_9ROSA|nr:hypothetical protein FNV43_RR18453 [Rhamnella rubrinervis]
MSSAFSEQILADKLSKVNSTQQCIESLSHWCIVHRSKAELVVTTWDKQFHNSQMVQKVPSSLKDVREKGDDNGKKVVSRLVSSKPLLCVFCLSTSHQLCEHMGGKKSIWIRAQSLKEVMLGEEVPPPLELSNKKRSRSVKIVKKDSRSTRTKLSSGGTADKIVSAFHAMLSEHSNEDAEMSKCKSAVQSVRKLEKEVDIVCSNVKDPKRKILAKELEEDENVLKQCIEKLKSIEASRLALVSQLKEALNEQDFCFGDDDELITCFVNSIVVAQAQVEEASSMRKRLDDEEYVIKPSTASTPPIDANVKAGQTPKKSAAAIAAEVAEKLAASSSSQLIMSSVLSTFAAEEAKSAGLTKAFTSDSCLRHQPLPPPPPPQNHPYQSVLSSQTTVQNQAPNTQAQYHLLSNPTSQQYLQPSGGVMTPYGYGSVPTLPPGPPQPPPHMVNTMVPLAQQTQQQPMSLAQQSASITQQSPGAPSLRPLQPPGMVYYGNLHASQ